MEFHLTNEYYPGEVLLHVKHLISKENHARICYNSIQCSLIFLFISSAFIASIIFVVVSLIVYVGAFFFSFDFSDTFQMTDFSFQESYFVLFMS